MAGTLHPVGPLGVPCPNTKTSSGGRAGTLHPVGPLGAPCPNTKTSSGGRAGTLHPVGPLGAPCANTKTSTGGQERYIQETYFELPYPRQPKKNTAMGRMNMHATNVRTEGRLYDEGTDDPGKVATHKVQMTYGRW